MVYMITGLYKVHEIPEKPVHLEVKRSSSKPSQYLPRPPLLIRRGFELREKTTLMFMFSDWLRFLFVGLRCEKLISDCLNRNFRLPFPRYSHYLEYDNLILITRCVENWSRKEASHATLSLFLVAIGS